MSSTVFQRIQAKQQTQNQSGMSLNFGQAVQNTAELEVPAPDGQFRAPLVDSQNTNKQGFFDKFLFGKEGQGNREGTVGQSGLGTTIDTLQGLSQLYFGLKSFGLAKDQFKQSKREFNLNFGAQASITNANLENQQAARVSSGSKSQAEADAFLAKNRIQTGTGG